MNTNLNSERTSWRSHRSGYGIALGGLGLVALGVVFLLHNLGYMVLGNWWALFILLPAGGTFIGAAAAYREAGRLTPAVRGSLVAGSILTLVAAIFLFNLDWGLMWPLFIVIVGAGALLAAFTDR